MKNLGLLSWMSQLGLNVALPPVGFILLGCYVRNRFSLGNWVIWVSIALGLVFSVQGLWSSLRKMHRLAEEKDRDEPPVSFNDHE